MARYYGSLAPVASDLDQMEAAMDMAYSFGDGDWDEPVRRYNIPGMERPNLLLIDDDADQLLLFSTLLRQAGYDVITTVRARDALNILRTEHIDCVVCDLMMPRHDGKDFLTEMQVLFPYSNIPVILITAGTTDRKTELLSAGASMFCHKNQARQKLTGYIAQLLNENEHC